MAWLTQIFSKMAEKSTFCVRNLQVSRFFFDFETSDELFLLNFSRRIHFWSYLTRLFFVFCSKSVIDLYQNEKNYGFRLSCTTKTTRNTESFYIFRLWSSSMILHKHFECYHDLFKWYFHILITLHTISSISASKKSTFAR